MEVISIKMNDEKLYHLDCVLFPLDDKRTVAATSVMDKEDIKALEKVTEVIDIPKEYIYNGWTNSIRIGDKVFHAWDHSNKEIDKFYGNLGFYTVPILLDEFDKSIVVYGTENSVCDDIIKLFKESTEITLYVPATPVIVILAPTSNTNPLSNLKVGKTKPVDEVKVTD